MVAFKVQLVLLLVLQFVQKGRAELYKPEQTIPCSSMLICPQEWPCCSQYGECGSGPMCISGCNPKFSFDEQSCLPMPALIHPMKVSYMAGSASNLKKRKSEEVSAEVNSSERMNPKDGFVASTTESELKRRGIINHVDYLVTPNSSEAAEMLKIYDFTHSGFTDLNTATEEILLNMPQKSTGSIITSARSMLYGKVSTRIKSSRSRGVITAIVLMSATGDEIDFEFLGSELTTVQTNYYSQGELIYSKMQRHLVSSDTWKNYHDYAIDWNEDYIEWFVDGQLIRRLDKKDTWDANSKSFKYPQTPMRLEVAIWPGGAEENAAGTISWAGGYIDWENSPDILESGKFTASINQLEMSPKKNMFSAGIQECLDSLNEFSYIVENDLSKVSYAYDSGIGNIYNEQSISTYCNIIPHVSSYTDSGLSLPRSMLTYFGEMGDKQNEYINNSDKLKDNEQEYQLLEGEEHNRNQREEESKINRRKQQQGKRKSDESDRVEEETRNDEENIESVKYNKNQDEYKFHQVKQNKSLNYSIEIIGFENKTSTYSHSLNVYPNSEEENDYRDNKQKSSAYSLFKNSNLITILKQHLLLITAFLR